MNDSTNGPQTNGNGNGNGNGKEELSWLEKQLIEKRRVAKDHNLSIGARFLFGFLLECSWLHSYGGREPGVIAASVSELSKWLGKSRRVISHWKRQLVSGRYMWIKKEAIANSIYPRHVMHMRCLVGDAPDEIYKTQLLPAKEPSADSVGDEKVPSSGDGPAGSAPEQPPSLFLPKSPDGQGQEQALAMSPEVHAQGKKSALGSAEKVHGQGKKSTLKPASKTGPQGKKSTLPVSQIAPSQGKKGALPTGAKVHGQGTKPAHIRRSLRRSETHGDQKGGTPPPQSADEEAFNRWVKTLGPDPWASRIEPQLAKFRAQLKAGVAPESEPMLKRKIAYLVELLEGPQPKMAAKKPGPARALPKEEKPLTEAELLEGARYALKNGLLGTLTDEQRRLLRKAGEL